MVWVAYVVCAIVWLHKVAYSNGIRSNWIEWNGTFCSIPFFWYRNYFSKDTICLFNVHIICFDWRLWKTLFNMYYHLFLSSQMLNVKLLSTEKDNIILITRREKNLSTKKMSAKQMSLQTCYSPFPWNFAIISTKKDKSYWVGDWELKSNVQNENKN